jgi:hypothetical protein
MENILRKIEEPTDSEKMYLILKDIIRENNELQNKENKLLFEINPNNELESILNDKIKFKNFLYSAKNKIKEEYNDFRDFYNLKIKEDRDYIVNKIKEFSGSFTKKFKKD